MSGQSRQRWTDWKRNRRKVVRRQMAKDISPSDLRYPDLPSEFEVQSRIYTELRSRGLDVRAEVKGGVRCRFDLVIFSEKKPIRIIEVKKRRIRANSKSPVMQNQRHLMLGQVERYSLYGVPVDLVQGPKDAEFYLSIFQIDMEPYANITKKHERVVKAKKSRLVVGQQVTLMGQVVDVTP